MRHDPLCICAEDEYRCRHCFIEDCSCDCVAIRRVRPLITNDALDAVRESIVALPHFGDFVDTADAFAAIDALRGERYSDSHQPQIDGTEAHDD